MFSGTPETLDRALAANPDVQLPFHSDGGQFSFARRGYGLIEKIAVDGGRKTVVK